MSDTEIIEQLKQGNQLAFKKLVDTHQKLVVNTCYGLVQNREDAEDVAQEVFVEVYRNIEKFRSDSKLSTWLYRIAVNRSLNHIRDNKKHKWFQGFDDEEAAANKDLLRAKTADSDEPEYDLENKQRALILKEAINSLPKNQKVAFTLSKYEELSYHEIAEVMDLSVSSVESLLFRAKKGLQKKLYKCYKKKCM
ncbi:sigma-70 family RNA polymerase sigma factor [uncultured Draconibacterium sp.]|uniref:sigma-70 family RNA polymerase sigma factor n=1 Tax=uncultured Draconibacterium sp. TaxID=1573823 RepID=UPI0029C65E11|nr:sigma-70 family RNA polymerase sigma factor [uncultured Draconibacterium sp.]